MKLNKINRLTFIDITTNPPPPPPQYALNRVFTYFCFFSTLLFALGCQTTTKDNTTPAPEKIIVTFDSQGGNTVLPQLVTVGEQAKRPTNNPTKENNVFKGWFTEATGGTEVTFPLIVTESKILYAQWQPEIITVSFDTQGGNLVIDQTITKGGGQIIEPNAPEKAGNRFKGWFTEASGGTKITFPLTVTVNKIIYAQWQPTTREALAVEINRAISNLGNNANLNYIDTSLITNMEGLFERKRDFAGNISDWNVSAVTNMGAMFRGAVNFNSDIGNWNVSAVTNMVNMFQFATKFNYDLNNWNVSGVLKMTNMFEGAEAFNGNISLWNVSAVTRMASMFNSATAFNSDISEWNVSAVTSMQWMFSSAIAFNSNISRWNVSSVKFMAGMFQGATNFNQFLNNWNTIAVTDVIGSDIFQRSGMTIIPEWSKR